MPGLFNAGSFLSRKTMSYHMVIAHYAWTFEARFGTLATCMLRKVGFSGTPQRQAEPLRTLGNWLLTGRREYLIDRKISTFAKLDGPRVQRRGF